MLNTYKKTWRNKMRERMIKNLVEDGFTKKKSVEIVRIMTETVKEVATEKETFRIAGLGKIESYELKEREGNAFGNKFKVGARKTLKLRVSPVLKEKLNK